jgi:hypothetical protein
VKRDIEWVEKLENKVKRTVRVKFPGKGKINWQFKRSDEELWDYNTPPSVADWSMLMERVDALYHRKRCAFKDFDLVQRMLKQAEKENATSPEKPS